MKIFILLTIFLLASSCYGQCEQYYIVQDGDTCPDIMLYYDISTDYFWSLNPGLDCLNLQNDQDVCIAGVPVSSGNDSSGAGEEEQSQDGTEEEEESQASTEEQQQIPDSTEEEEENQSSTEEEHLQESAGEEEQSQGSTEVEEQNPTEEEQNPAVGGEEETQTSTGVEEQNPSEEEQNPAVVEEENEEIIFEEFQGNYTGEIVQSSHNTSYIDEVIAAHQAYRDKYGSPELVWNYTLAYSATRWAQYLAANDLMVHTTDFSYGENIVGSDGVILSPTWYVSWWGDEERYFVPGTTIFNDSASTTGSLSAIGHFTQVVWRATTSVGCGMVTIGQVTRMVCQYYPPGNWWNYQIFVNYLSS